MIGNYSCRWTITFENHFTADYYALDYVKFDGFKDEAISLLNNVIFKNETTKILNGSNHDDILHVTSNVKTVNGGDGDDTYILCGQHDVTIKDIGGRDTIKLVDLNSA